jgi:hypothetical protein
MFGINFTDAVLWVVALVVSLAYIYWCFRSAFCIHHYSALMMEAATTSESSVNFYQNTQCNNPEDSNPHTHHLRTWNLTWIIFVPASIILCRSEVSMCITYRFQCSFLQFLYQFYFNHHITAISIQCLYSVNKIWHLQTLILSLLAAARGSSIHLQQQTETKLLILVFTINIKQQNRNNYMVK